MAGWVSVLAEDFSPHRKLEEVWRVVQQALGDTTRRGGMGLYRADGGY